MSSLYSAESLCKAGEDDTLDIITDFSGIWPMFSHNLWASCRFEILLHLPENDALITTSLLYFPLYLLHLN